MRPAQGLFHHFSCILSPSEWNIIYLFYTEVGKRNLLPTLLPGVIFPGQGDMYKQGTGNKGKGPAGPCREVAWPAVQPSVTGMSGGRGTCYEVVATRVDFLSQCFPGNSILKLWRSFKPVLIIPRCSDEEKNSCVTG